MKTTRRGSNVDKGCRVWGARSAQALVNSHVDGTRVCRERGAGETGRENPQYGWTWMPLYEWGVWSVYYGNRWIGGFLEQKWKMYQIYRRQLRQDSESPVKKWMVKIASLLPLLQGKMRGAKDLIQRERIWSRIRTNGISWQASITSFVLVTRKRSTDASTHCSQ